jgi:hypothetical protein
MKKERIKGFVAGVLLTALLSSTLAFANSGIISEIHYGIRVVLNGRPVHFDADSQPFVMNERTFLPLRAMADLLGLPIDFDAEQNTVHVGHEIHPIVGAWEDGGGGSASLPWQHLFEFFADGTGRHIQIHENGEETVFGYLTWNDSDSSITYTAFPWIDDDEFDYDIRFAVFDNVLGYGELLVLHLIIDESFDEILPLVRINDQ